MVGKTTRPPVQPLTVAIIQLFMQMFMLPGSRADQLPQLTDYTSVRCLGQPWYYNAHRVPKIPNRGEPGAAARGEPACSLTNICFQPAKQRFVVYRPESLAKVPVLYDGAGKPYFGYPKTCFQSGIKGLGNARDFTVYYAKTLLRSGPIPSDAVRLGSVYLLGNAQVTKLLHANVGHYLWEQAVAWSNLIGAFNATRKTVRFIATNLRGTACPEGFHAGLKGRLDALFPEGPLPVGNPSCAKPPPPMVCFEELLVGESRMAVFWDAAQYAHEPSYAQTVAARHPQVNVEVPKHPRIIVMLKKGRRTPTNYKEITDMLETRLKFVPITVLKRASDHLADMAIVSEHTLMITPIGGISTLASFLPRGSAVLQLGFWHSDLNTTSDLDSPRLIRTNNVEVRTVPTTLQQLDPQCQPYEKFRNHSGSKVNCDYKVDLKVLFDMTVESLLHWILRYGTREQLAALLAAAGAALSGRMDATVAGQSSKVALRHGHEGMAKLANLYFPASSAAEQ